MISPISSLVSSVLGSSGADALRSSAVAAPTAAAQAGGAADFGQVMAQVSSDAVNTLKSAEAASIQGLQGKVSTQQVVEAVLKAQETLQTAVSVRDKAVSAYQEITRMQI